MRNSSILKWAQNNKTNKLLTNGKSKDEKGNKNWIHSPDALLKGHVVYLVKFLGSTEVDKPKGIEVVKQGIQKLKFSQQLRKSEGNAKTPKVELTISVDGVAIQDPKTKNTMHQYPLHKISYCADDKAEKRFFSFIAKEGDSEKHTCFVFVSDKLAEEITLTIGQAFELAYKKFLDTSGKDLEIKKQLLILQKRIGLLENENGELKKRLKDVADIKGQSDIQQYLKNNGIKDLCSVRDPSENSSIGNGSTTSGMNSMTEEDDEFSSSAVESFNAEQQLICLDANKLDGLSLDDLNDDDFNPREGDDVRGASSSSSSDDSDFNPRAENGALPALPPRDNKKILPPPPKNNNNPFFNNDSTDPFGMTAFDRITPPKKTIDAFESGITLGNFSLDELDPLKK